MVQKVSKEEAERLCKETTERELAKLHEQLKNREVKDEFFRDDDSEESDSDDSDNPFALNSDEEREERKEREKREGRARMRAEAGMRQDVQPVMQIPAYVTQGSGTTEALKQIVQQQKVINDLNRKIMKLKLQKQDVETRKRYLTLDLSNEQEKLAQAKQKADELKKRLDLEKEVVKKTKHDLFMTTLLSRAQTTVILGITLGYTYLSYYA